jgi:hypothetical protein
MSVRVTKMFISEFTKSDILPSLVRQRTIPTKRPPLIGEVSANFRLITVKKGKIFPVLNE